MMETFTPKPRMKNPATIIPGAGQAIQALNAAIEKTGPPKEVLELVHLRASQINGCSFCVDLGWKMARKNGESEDRLFAVAAWRESPCFTEAERAALLLAEHATRLADQLDPVPDSVWEEVSRHFDESELAAIVLTIAMTNLYNRVNVTLRQPAGSWG
jgi:AhpD family alkylhydroperoxidase